MSPRHLALWLPSALLLLQVPGCFLLSCPSTVHGTVGGSLRVQCWYEKRYKENSKYWCRDSLLSCDKIVETAGSSREGRRGRVTIRDHPANLSFTVTLEHLTLQDAGSYLCGIDVSWQQNPEFKVAVSVFPERLSYCTTTQLAILQSASGSHFNVVTSTVGPPLLSVQTWPSSTRGNTSSPSPQPRCLFSCLHFLLLVFLKVPLFLSMLIAILWVNRSQRGSGWR